MPYIKKMSIKTKLLIYEYKQMYPSLSPEDISDIFNVDLNIVIHLFKEGEINVPSKMNKI